jgi:hypothetical protein
MFRNKIAPSKILMSLKNIELNIGLKGSLIFSELERRFFEATRKKSSDLEKIKFGWSRGATAPQGGTL